MVIFFNVMIFLCQKNSVEIIHRKIVIIKATDDLRECKSRKRNHIFNKQGMSLTACSTDNTLNGNFDFSSKEIIVSRIGRMHMPVMTATGTSASINLVPVK